jgi:hypothetical protein
MLFSFANASAASAAVRSWTNRVPTAYDVRPRSATRWRAVVPGEDAGVGVAGLRAAQRRLQARAADHTAGADRFGLRGLGDLPGVGEEQLRVDVIVGVAVGQGVVTPGAVR